MDNAMQFLDELKKGMQHQVEQAIEDWDYQDFSPDKRRALLEEEVSNDVDDDRQPEPGAMQLILKDSNRQLNWVGLSPEAALEDFDCGATLAAHASLSYESKVVIMCTPAGGIQGTPDADSLQRFLDKAQHMNPQLLADALYARLQDPNTCWQIRSKMLVLVHALTEASHPLAPHFLPSLQNNAALLQQMEKLRTLDHNHVVRENARKAMSLLRSNGMNPMLIVNDPAPAKPHVRHVRAARDQDSTLASVRKKSAVAKKTTTPPPPPLMAPKMDTRPRDELQQHTSPKIARAALASWRRRKSQENVFGSDMQANAMPFQHPSDAVMYKQQLMMQQSNGYTTSNAMNQQGQPMALHAILTTPLHSRWHALRAMVTVQVARATMPTSRARHAPPAASAKASSSIPRPLSSPVSSSSSKNRSSNVFWIKLNFTVKAARLRTLKRQKYQHLQEEMLLKARGLLKNWEDGPVLLIEDLYRHAAGERDAQELMNYTPEALALRFSLRNDPRVLRVVKELWSIDTGPRDALGCIGQRAYMALFRRIAKSVDANAVLPSKRRRKLEKTILDDWTRDSKGEAHMSFVDFFDSVFELADLWCETIESDEYVTFLEKIRDRISVPPRRSTVAATGVAVRVLRPIKKVRPLHDEEVSSESSTSSSSTSASSSSEQEDETEVRPTEMDDIGNSSQVHRFLTAKDLRETTTRNPHMLTRKINSATGALGSQTLRTSSTTISAARGIASRLSLEASRQWQSRSSIVGSSFHFETDYDAATATSGRGSASSTDLSALVEGTAFQPTGGALASSSTSYPKSMMVATAGSLEKRKSTSSSSKAITTDVVIEARPRTPMIAIHVVDSGINGIFNSSSSSAAAGAALGGTFSTGRSSMFAPGTRSAIMNLARVNKNYGNKGVANMLTGAGFREVVFNAMQSDTRGPSSSNHPHATMTVAAPNERRHDGGSHMNAVVGAQLQMESSFAASSPISSHSTTPSSHAGGSLSVASTPFERHQESSCVGSAIDVQLRADVTSPSTRSYAMNPSRDMTSGPLLTAILNNQQQHAPLAPTSMTASQQEPADSYDSTYLGVNATRRTVADMTSRGHSRQQQRGALNGGNDTVSRQTTLAPSATDSSSFTHTSYSELGATSPSRRQSNPTQRRGPQGHSASSSPKKRVLPPMSPIQQLQHQSIPYHLHPKTTIDNDSLISSYGNNNNNAVDFSASYTMTSYASDPRIATANSLPPHAAHAVNMRLTPVATRSKHEPNAAYNDAADSSAPSLWYGLNGAREPHHQRRKPSQGHVPTLPTDAKSLRANQVPAATLRQQRPRSGDTFKDVSPWDTYPDDDEFLNRLWESHSLVENDDSEAVSSLVVNTEMNDTTQQHQSPHRATRSILPSGGNTRSTRVDTSPLLRVTSLGTASFSGNVGNLINTAQQLHHSSSAPDTSVPGKSVDTVMQHVILHLPPTELGHPQIAPSQSLPSRESLTPTTRSRKSREINGVMLTGLAMRVERATATPAAGKGSSNQTLAPLLRVGDDDSKRSSSPLFHMDKLTPQPDVATLEGLSDQDRVKMSPERDDITILLNAHRELVLRPTRKEDDIAANGHKPHPTRSEMMVRRYRYTFGKVKHP